MLRCRVIPIILLKDGGVVKSVKFKNHRYVGDVINTVKIFNEKEVDELIVLDISASMKNQSPDFDLITNIASECFMPLGYGGGLRNIKDIETIFKLGCEKAIINTAAVLDPYIIQNAVDIFGGQSIVASIDVKKVGLLNRYMAFIEGGTKRVKKPLADLITRMQEIGVGEIILNSIDRDGTMMGYDLSLLRLVSKICCIPLVACGGARTLNDLTSAIKIGNASAVAAGSMFVYHGKHNAVLISYPTSDEIDQIGQ